MIDNVLNIVNIYIHSAFTSMDICSVAQNFNIIQGKKKLLGREYLLCYITF